MHLIDRIPEYEYAKGLLQISCAMILDHLIATYKGIFYFKQIFSYFKAMNAKISDFKSLFLKFVIILEYGQLNCMPLI